MNLLVICLIRFFLKHFGIAIIYVIINWIMHKTFQSKLDQIEKSDIYPFHMPGHKRQSIGTPICDIYKRDITEIDGYDNLHDPKEFILAEEQFGARLFGSEECFYLVNGSSCGILAAIMSVADRPGRYLVARNCHKSVFHGLYLSGKDAQYIYPEGCEDIPFSGSISVMELEQKLSQDDYCAVIVTSPTYEGVVSDVRAICEAAHKKGIPVIVDEAHGAHLGIWGGDGFFPDSAIRCGADIVIQSTHKTLPAMTQTALLHVQGDLIDRRKLKEHLAVFQSSSPSYILMESISDALHFCAEHKEELVKAYRQRLDAFYQGTEKLKCFYCIRPQILQKDFAYAFDPGKLVICIKDGIDLTGAGLSHILRTDYHIEPEMSEAQYVIAMTSVMDTAEGFARLVSALKEIDTRFADSSKEMPDRDKKHRMPLLEHELTIRQALACEGRKLRIQDTACMVSREYIYLYPPGIPLVVPGEQITAEVIDYLQGKMEAGLLIKGPANIDQNKIMCIGKAQTERESL